MKKEEAIIKIDSRNRITIPKRLAKDLPNLYKIYEHDHKIILEPVLEVPQEERWLFNPKNKAIVAELKKALKQRADQDIDLSSLE